MELPKLGTTRTSRYAVYRGITFEVVQTESTNTFFCLYIYLHDFIFCDIKDLRYCKENEHKEACGGYNWLADLFSPAGQSQTYFSREDGVSKFGCDYNHLWHHEQGYHGSWDGCTGDAVAIIDALHEKIQLRVVDRETGRIEVEATPDRKGRLK